MNEIKNLLETHKIKPTFQRLCIMDYLLKHPEHPTADTIYEQMVKTIPTISRTTVYNTLHCLADNGLIGEITITGLETRYDAMTKSHHHFFCKKCGSVIDLDIKCPFSNDQHTSFDGHEIQEVHGYFKGICNSCLTNS